MIRFWPLAVLLALAPAARAAGGEYEEMESQSQLSEAETFEQTAPAATAAGLGLQSAAVLQAAPGRWSYEFVRVDAAGNAQVLSKLDENRPTMPASTLKLFTGWLGFLRGALPVDRLARMLQFSQNSVADRLLRKLGGSSALSRLVAPLGPARGEFVAHDGSGFSAGDRVTAHLETEFLRRILTTKDATGHGKDYDGFKVLLAQPGKPGTLEDRLPSLAGALYAKTGTLTYTGVVSLAGFVETADGGAVVFSVIGTNVRRRRESPHKNRDEARDALDRLVELNVAAAGAAVQAPKLPDPSVAMEPARVRVLQAVSGRLP